EVQGRDAYWAAVSDDGRTAISVELGKAVRFHDLTTGKVTHEHADAHPRPIVLSPAGDKMVCIDGTVRNVADRKELFHLGWVYESKPGVRCGADGRRLVAAVRAKSLGTALLDSPPAEEITVFDVVEGKELRRFGRRFGKHYTVDAAALSC